jgi:hypothetical protein
MPAVNYYQIDRGGYIWDIAGTIENKVLKIHKVHGDISNPELLNEAITALAQSLSLGIELDDERAREAILKAIGVA